MRKSLYCLHVEEKVLLLLLVISLGLRDILVPVGYSVYYCLMLIFIIPLVVLFKNLFYKNISKKEIMILLIVSCFYLLIVPLNSNGVKYVLPLIYASIAFRNVDYRFIAKSFLLMQSLCILIRLVLIDCNIISPQVFDTEKIQKGVSTDLAYGNPNTLGFVFFSIVCYIYLLSYQKYRLISFCMIFFISIFSYNYTASRTAFFSSLILLTTYFLPRDFYQRYINKNILYMIPLILVFVFLFSEYILSRYSQLDILLSGRLRYFVLLLNLFSSPINFITGVQMDFNNLEIAVDNVIAYMLICGGIIFPLLFLRQYAFLVENKEKIPFDVISVLIIIILSGISENSWAKFGMSVASFFWILLYNKTYIENKLDYTILPSR